ncbi:MAG TPA: hypothetical protein VMR34_01320 [Candidatus Saccharimonadales bacterium]|nr:hypothetical protein [Candidatus Saccharimonadales bacterium]
MTEQDNVIDLQGAKEKRDSVDPPIDPSLVNALEDYFSPPDGPYEWNEGRALRRFHEAATLAIEERRLRQVTDHTEE